MKTPNKDKVYVLTDLNNDQLIELHKEIYPNDVKVKELITIVKKRGFKHLVYVDRFNEWKISNIRDYFIKENNILLHNALELFNK